MNSSPIGLTPNPVGPLPPLPIPMPLPEPPQPPQPPIPQLDPPQIRLPQPFPFPPQLRTLRCGCYLLNYTPNNSRFTAYDGTMRVECHSGGRTASGDLYQRPVIFLPFPFPGPGIPGIPGRPGFPRRRPIMLPGPSPANGIPALARSRYRYYLRVTQLPEFIVFGQSFTLGLEMYRFTAPNTWVNEGAFTARMRWTTAPAGYPSSNDYLAGDVKNSGGTVVGRLTMGWVSKYLRKATIEIDRVSASEAPLSNGSGIDWRDVFDELDWDVNVVQSDSNLTEPSGEFWSDAELHQAMLTRRDSSNLDVEWRYHLIAVRRLDSTSRGIMYDAFSTDSNNVPREGAAISSHWVIPNSSTWGLVRGQRFGAADAPYFRTAVHELGHAMGLLHNTVDNGFMNTTGVIASSGTAATPFPNNVQWAFAPEDAKRLRHYPDVFVRPGGVSFGGASTTAPPITPTDLEVELSELELRVSPLLEAVPLGAPVRVNIELTNTSDQPVVAPASLSMKTGFVSGHVAGPSAAVRTFSPLVRCIEEHPLAVLQPGESLTHSLTLLRGGQGALFAAPGLHHVEVEVHWDLDGVEVATSGETTVLVTAAVDADHAAAARKLLSTPDTLLTLVLGGDHLDEGIDAIQAALDNPVLRPHYAYIEAKRLAKGFGQRAAKPKVAQELVEPDATVMSPAEAKKAAKFSDRQSGGTSCQDQHTVS